jgi:hypothetical protein
MDPSRIELLHRAAVARGEPFYLDPTSGLYVLTAQALRERGHCCGRGCRHCPYGPAAQSSSPTDDRGPGRSPR